MFKQFLILLFIPALAFASLGEKNSSKIKIIQGTESDVSYSNYSVVQTVSPTLIIHEYVNSNGKIFAVTWKGNAHPDLTKVLGSYYQEYSSTVKVNGKEMRRKAEKTETKNVVVTRSGHMRGIKGTAYLPKLLPANFDILKDLQ
jgi:hypothetical protein